jgi:hypothetical protein
VKDTDFQENEAVSPVVNEKYWRPNDLGVCNYFGMVFDSWMVSEGEPQRQREILTTSGSSMTYFTYVWQLLRSVWQTYPLHQLTISGNMTLLHRQVGLDVVLCQCQVDLVVWEISV